MQVLWECELGWSCMVTASCLCIYGVGYYRIQYVYPGGHFACRCVSVCVSLGWFRDDAFSLYVFGRNSVWLTLTTAFDWVPYFMSAVLVTVNCIGVRSSTSDTAYNVLSRTDCVRDQLLGVPYAR